MTPLDEFLTRYPAATQRSYRHTLNELTALTGASATQATRAQVADYLAAIAELAPSTRARKIATLSALFGWLILTGQRSDNPTLGLRRPRVDRLRTVRYLDADATVRLVEAVGEDPRALALVWVMCHGLRISEAVGLDTDCLEGDVLRVTGKGGRTRRVPLEPAALRALYAYRGRRRSGPMFLGRSGRLSTSRVSRIINEATTNALGERWNPHSLRHGFGTQLARSGTNAFVIQRLLGHAGVGTTQLYVQLDDRSLREALRRKPLAQRAQEQRFTILDGGDEMTGADSSLQGVTAPVGEDSSVPPASLRRARP